MERDLVEYRRWCVEITGYEWVGTCEDDQEKEIFHYEREYFPTHAEALEKVKEFTQMAEDEEFANYAVECEEDSDVVTRKEYENYFENYELIE